MCEIGFGFFEGEAGIDSAVFFDEGEEVVLVGEAGEYFGGDFWRR